MSQLRNLSFCDAEGLFIVMVVNYSNNKEKNYLFALKESSNSETYSQQTQPLTTQSFCDANGLLFFIFYL